MDIHLSPTKMLAPTLRTPAEPSQSSVIPENETFQQAFHAASGETDTPEKIGGVAKQFEALMIGQMLKSAREASGGGWLGNEDDQGDQTGSLVMEMAEQGFSQAMATRGGLGIAKMVTANLERGLAKTASGQSKTASSDAEAPRPAPPLKSTETNTGWQR
jgi:Rod binding domain-containing protein